MNILIIECDSELSRDGVNTISAYYPKEGNHQIEFIDQHEVNGNYSPPSVKVYTPHDWNDNFTLALAQAYQLVAERMFGLHLREIKEKIRNNS